MKNSHKNAPKKEKRSKSSRKKIKILVGVLIAFAVLIGILYSTYALFFNPYRFANYDAWFEGKPATLSFETILTKDQALQDLKFVIDRLGERHPACVNGIPSNVQEQYNEEIAALEENVSVKDLYRASSRILALMRDTHTIMDVRFSSPSRYIEGISFEWQGDRLYQISENEKLEVIEINQIPIADLYTEFTSIFSYEIEDYAKAVFAYILYSENWFVRMNIDTSDGITFTYPDKQENYSFITYDSNSESSEAAPFVYYSLDEEHNLGILTLEECNTNDEYKRVVRSFFEQVKMNRVEHIVLDLRGNGGGDSGVVDEFMRYLSVDVYDAGWFNHRYGPLLIKIDSSSTKNQQFTDLVYNGNIYVLTDVWTASAATTFTARLKSNQLASVVGQQSGNAQEFGELVPFSTPNSNLLVGISNKQYFRGNELGDTKYTMPDYLCAPEEALEKVYEIIQTT